MLTCSHYHWVERGQFNHNKIEYGTIEQANRVADRIIIGPDKCEAPLLFRVGWQGHGYGCDQGADVVIEFVCANHHTTQYKGPLPFNLGYEGEIGPSFNEWLTRKINEDMAGQ